MKDSPQDVYAKHLPYDYGYPLRGPEPMSGLPETYQDDGLQIGDVGIVDKNGQFDVLFNICKGSDNCLHDRRGVPENFQPTREGEVNHRDNAIPPGPIYSHGMTQILNPTEHCVDYQFHSSGRAGAILILPHGATSAELLSPEQFRKVAMKNALDWYEFAKKCYDDPHLDRSLYLITGFYKAPFWSLGSFNEHKDDTGTIEARRDDANPNVYLLKFSFYADWRCCRGDAGQSVNQTVFIVGFKITFNSWLPDPVVLSVKETETTWSKLVRLLKACFHRLYHFSGGYGQYAAMDVEHRPELSQPFHPSDIINRFLLSKNPNFKVAITHDNQWMDMMKGGLTDEDLLHEDRLETFLAPRYTISVDSGSENTTVFLQGKTRGAAEAVSSVVDPCDSSPGFEFSPPPTPPLDNPWIVITRIRAQHIHSGFKRMPVGFYVLVQTDGDQRRTQNKSVRLNDSSIEWEDVILLPSKASGEVRFTVYASFELEPMLGNGEVLYTSEAPVEELVSGTYLVLFSPGELGTAAPPSLLITLGRRYSNHAAVVSSGDDSNQLDSEESSVIIRETNLGQEALLRYYNEYRREELENAVQHFECARRDCPLTHRFRAVVLVNLAKAMFISYRANPIGTNLNESIQLYRQALNLRGPGHPDRAATLLQLAQALLFCCETKDYAEPVAREIYELISQSQEFSQYSHESQAANLVLETLERCSVVYHGHFVGLDKFVRQLEDSTRVPPDGYFDIPQRLTNLSTMLWIRYQQRRNLSDLNRSLDLNERALQLLPACDPNRLPVLKTRSTALWELFEMDGDLSHLTALIVLDEEALRLIPDGHPERSYWVNNYKGHLAEMLECFGNAAVEAREYEEAIAQYFRAVTVLQSAHS